MTICLLASIVEANPRSLSGDLAWPTSLISCVPSKQARMTLRSPSGWDRGSTVSRRRGPSAAPERHERRPLDAGDALTCGVWGWR
jgi:hypothetical protein